jgi:hypothetical protein
MHPISPRSQEASLIPVFVFLAATALAAAGAHPFAGSWNDGSRLAAVESIADRATLVIDDSIFVQVPAGTISRGVPPYPPGDRALLEHGTMDKLLIEGHFYSDKPYVVSFLMAGLYRGMRAVGMPSAADRPDEFCRSLTLCTSGLAYGVAVLCIYLLARQLGLPRSVRLALAASLALATVALPYSRYVNNHILLLGVMSVLLLQLVWLAEGRGEGHGEPPHPQPLAPASGARGKRRRQPPYPQPLSPEAEERGGRIWWRPLLIGSLAGLAYTLDLGAGPVLLVCLFPLIVYRCRRLAPVALFVLGVLPWLVAHHAINFAVGGVLKPMNAVPEYLAWPGSPFSTQNLTGVWRHGPVKLVVYSLALLFGKHGFLCHNLPLLLAVPALVFLLLRRLPERPELAFDAAWCGGTWLLYAIFSNNYGGACCSIRWFVPFLAPGFHALAVYLRERPEHRTDFYVLSLVGEILGAIMWWYGPWMRHMVPLYWPLVGIGLLGWLACAWRRHRSIPDHSQEGKHEYPGGRTAA